MNVAEANRYILERLDNELVVNLYYHGPHHTRDVYYSAIEIANYLNVDEEEKDLVRVAAAYHDSGFLFQYKDHEDAGCELARQVLPGYGFNAGQVEKICGMIMATKIPQSPQNLLEQILCDADLDYLGRDDFYSIGKTLFEEFKAYNIIADEQQWNRLQLNFLGKHAYFTEFGQKLRQPRKQEYLSEIEKLVLSYENS